MRVASTVTPFVAAVLVVASCLVSGAPSRAQQAAPAAGQQPIPAGNAFILGRVVDAGTGEAIANAVVTITSYGALPGSAPGSAAAMAAVTSETLTPGKPQSELSNADGYFVFAGISGGRYGMSVTAAGYELGGYLQTKPLGTIHFIDLGQDEKKGDVKIRMWKDGSISGVVLDEAGEPAVGAIVKAVQRQAVNGRLRYLLSGQATTDDRGVYRMAQLLPGDYVVGLFHTASTVPAAVADLWDDNLASPSPAGQALMASVLGSGAPRTVGDTGIRVNDLSFQVNGFAFPPRIDNGRFLVYTTTFYPGVASLGQARAIKIVSGEDHPGIDLSLKLVTASRVSGTVTDSTGPTANVAVKLLTANVDEFTSENGVETATSLTDANGAFTFLGVPEGTYTLKVVKTSGTRAPPLPPGQPPASTAAISQTAWASQIVTVGAGDIAGLSVNLRDGFRVGGRIEFTGAAPKPDDAILVRANVTLLPIGPSSAGPPPAVVNTDGQFKSAAYPPGKYLVRASIPAPGWTLRSVLQGTKDLADEPFDLDGDLGGLVISFTDKTSQLSGSVVDAAGKPDPLADIIVFPADTDSWRQSAVGTRRIRLMSATKYGTYAITPLPPGKYYAVAVDSSLTDNWQESKFLERLQALATPVTIGEGENKSQALKTVVLR